MQSRGVGDSVCLRSSRRQFGFEGLNMMESTEDVEAPQERKEQVDHQHHHEGSDGHHHHHHHHLRANAHETEEEFGAVSGAKVETHEFDSDDEAFGRFEEGEEVTGWDVLVRRLARRRRLRQYFQDGVLHREHKTRKIGMDELFLDLIVVANIAALGHELRESFHGWAEIEKFFLLFQAVWFIWSDNAMLWNLFSNVRDILEKLGVFFTVCFLCGIGVGAHAAFYSATRWVSLSVWFGEFTVNTAMFVFSHMDPILRNLHATERASQYSAAIVCNLPYLIAAGLGPGNADAVKGLFWAAFGLNCFRRTVLPILLTRYANRFRPGGVRFAVNIEAMTEKFGLLTIIVLGESLLAILFEAGTLISNGDTGRLFLGALFGVWMTYSIFTIYFDIDNRILPGGTHAIRFNRYAGIAWSTLHLFLHATLILSATGVGLALRYSSLGGVQHRAETISEDLQKFDDSHRWLLLAPLAMALWILDTQAWLHKSSEHANSKAIRTFFGFLVGLTLLLLPLAGDRISALSYLGIAGALVGLDAFVEFVVVEIDHLRIHGWVTHREADRRARESSAHSGPSQN